MHHITLVVAADEAGVIGSAGRLPWHLPNDLKHFKTLTLGHTVLMGRKTWDSIGQPLPGRDNWVVSRTAGFQAEGARVFAALNDALAAAGGRSLMVIGGAELYRQTLPLCRCIQLTRVHARVAGDTYLPAFDTERFRETACVHHPADARHAHAYSFITLERVARPGGEAVG